MNSEFHIEFEAADLISVFTKKQNIEKENEKSVQLSLYIDSNILL